MYDIGRGALSAAGVGVSVKPGDVAARGNFCTIDKDGNITDRRAGRISSEESAPIIEKLRRIQIPGVEIDLKQVKEYRFVIVMRGENLTPGLKDTDPQKVGVPPLRVIAEDEASQNAADLFNQWVEKAKQTLADEPKANCVTLRGFATDPELIPYDQAYGLNAACVAAYPMYKGVAKLVGMEIVDFDGETPADEFEAVKSAWDEHDFFFVHIKKTDSKGEDGDFEGKAHIIESVDQALPILLDLKPDVLIITGDHSTPAKMKSHSWHPVPFLLWAPETHMPDRQERFGERYCSVGGLGTISALDTMPLALAHANRIQKFGA